MFRQFPSEEFKEVILDSPQTFRYAISNYGRMISYTERFHDGRLIKGSLINGYRIFFYKVPSESTKITKKQFSFYKLVGMYFIPKQSEDQIHILHLDYNRSNDHISNLAWATKEQMLAHHKKSPFVIEARKKLLEFNIKNDGRKLTTTQVIRLKKTLLDPNRKTRLKILAKQFNVSEMQLHRIKTGENWGHIKV